MKGIKRLFGSSKFWIVMWDFTTSLGLYFAVKYAAPEYTGDVKFLIAALQPVYMMIIGGIAWEDAALKRNSGQPTDYLLHTPHVEVRMPGDDI